MPPELKRSNCIKYLMEVRWNLLFCKLCHNVFKKYVMLRIRPMMLHLLPFPFVESKIVVCKIVPYYVCVKNTITATRLTCSPKMSRLTTDTAHMHSECVAPNTHKRHTRTHTRISPNSPVCPSRERPDCSADWAEPGETAPASSAETNSQTTHGGHLPCDVQLWLATCYMSASVPFTCTRTFTL